MAKTNIEVTSWGLSMYGGWYINYIDNGAHNGVGGRTLKECLTKLNITRADLRNRVDN